jgi:hypothetical protein
MDKWADIFGGIVIVAMITTIVGHSGTSGDIKALGGAFAGSISAALGK